MKHTLFFMLLSALWWGGTETVQAEIKNGECNAEGANVTWTLDTETGKLEISGTGEMKDFESYDETPWFDYSSVITSVTVGNGVTAVGNYAFSDCTELTNLRIEDNADTLNIKRYAFTNCPLDTVYLGREFVDRIRQGIRVVPISPFMWKTSLVSLTIGNQVTAINRDAFCGCSGLTAITIPENVTSIGKEAFAGCTGLTNLRIEDSAETLEFTDCSEEHMPFADCPLDTVYLGRNISYDSNYSPFKDKRNLVSLTIGNQVTVIGASAFSGCTYLTSVTIPESVTTIGGDAFSDCWGLESITLYAINPPEIQNSFVRSDVYVYVPAESIALYKAAEGWKNLNIKYKVDGIGYDILSSDERTAKVINGGYSGDIVIPETMEYEGITYRVTAIGNDAFYDCSGLTSVTIPESVTTIGDGAFGGCSGLPSIMIPNSVTTIGDWAFGGCSGLTSIMIPNSVTSIGDGAFEDCSGLASVTIPENVTSIGNSAFSGCSNLTSITIPEGVTTIGYYAFEGCSGLTAITIPENVTSIGNSAFSGCSNLTSITIPEGVTTIGYYAFEGCSGLTAITIPENVISIGGGAFSDCTNLTSVKIDGVTTIEISAFTRCIGLEKFEGKFASNDNRCLIINDTLRFFAPSGLTEYTIPGTVKVIDDRVFEYYGTGLTSVTIPESVTTIGKRAFYECKGLKLVTIGDGVTSIGSYAFYRCYDLMSVTIPNSVTSINNCAFSGDTSLTSVTIPNSVTYIGYRAFSTCKGLTEITIPDGVTTIDGEAFDRCTGLKSVTIGKNVTTIGGQVFCECIRLKSVTAYNPTPVVDIVAFTGMDCSNCTLYVPAESVEAYLEEWRWFGTILPIVAYDFEAAPTITPTENDETITALSTFTLAFDERPALVGDSATVMKADSSAYYPARITASEDGKSFIIALQGDEQTKAAEYSLTEAGTYLLVIPAGTFGDDDFAADPKTGHSNPELTYTYTIKESEPVEPDVPSEPENPDTPDEPEVPDEPDEPIVPDEPDEPSSITETPSDAEHIAVYNLQGVLVLETDDAADLKTLQNGAYIVNGKTMIIAR